MIVNLRINGTEKYFNAPFSKEFFDLKKIVRACVQYMEINHLIVILLAYPVKIFLHLSTPKSCRTQKLLLPRNIYYRLSTFFLEASFFFTV